MRKGALTLLKELHEPHKLQQNAFARELVLRFSECSSAQWGEPEVARLRDIVLEAALTCRRAASRAQRDEQARRHFGIIVRYYLERQSMQTVAQELCISVRQCYRDRTAAARLVVEQLARQNVPRRVTPVVVYNAFVAEIDRASLLSEIGQYTGAIASFDAIAGSATDSAQRIHALCSKSEVLIRLANWAPARDCVRTADRLFHETMPAGGLSALASRSRIDFEKTKLKWETGGLARSPTLIEIAAGAHRLLSSSDPFAPDLGLDVLMATGYAFEACGEPARAHAYLEKAAQFAALCENPWRKCEVAIAQSRLERLRATSSCDFRTSDSKLRRDDDIVRIARRSGSPRTIVHSLLNLMQEALFVGDDSGVLAIGRLAVELAGRLDNPTFLAFTAALVGDSVVQTRYFAVFVDLVSAVDEPTLSAGTRVMFDLSRIVYYIRTKQYQPAWNVAVQLEEHARLPARSRMRGVLSSRLATILLGLGRKKQARRYVEQALESASRYNTAFAQVEALDVAAGIFDDPRFAQKADAIRRGLQTNLGQGSSIQRVR